eukprot:3955638-Ditylum_brightwellii.AAC.2
MDYGCYACTWDSSEDWTRDRIFLVLLTVQYHLESFGQHESTHSTLVGWGEGRGRSHESKSGDSGELHCDLCLEAM